MNGGFEIGYNHDEFLNGFNHKMAASQYLTLQTNLTNQRVESPGLLNMMTQNSMLKSANINHPGQKRFHFPVEYT